MTKKLSCTFLFAIVFALHLGVHSEQLIAQTLASQVENSLLTLTEMHGEIKGIHPFLEELHPIAIVKGDQLFIFDYDSSSANYRHEKTTPVPFPMPEGIRASFPLSIYGGRPSCVVTQDIFESRNGYVLLFHEFVHCSQSNSVEYALKERLKIAQIAAESNDYSWEISHRFPYNDSSFVSDYSLLFGALEDKDMKRIASYRSRLQRHLNLVDFEYLVWEEWKEGFARLIENRIQAHYGLDENNYGKEKPFNRVTFYHGGAKFIEHLIVQENDLFSNQEALFERMLNYAKED